MSQPERRTWKAPEPRSRACHIPLLPDRFPMPPGFTREMLDDTKLGPIVRPLADDAIGDVGRVL